MQSTTDVSVVIPCYRCIDTIARAVASIASQTLLPSEIILVDDHSEDGTLDKLYALQASYPNGWIKVIALDINRGAGEARNVGWDAASKTFVAFLDADDSWHPQKIEIQYLWMIHHPSVALTGHACEIGDEFERASWAPLEVNDVRFEFVTPASLLTRNLIPTSSVMLRRSLKYRFEEYKRYSEDYLLWAQICLDNNACFVSKVPLVKRHKESYGASGLSGNLWAMQKGEIATYHTLWRSGRVKTLAVIILQVWSFIKFFKRIVRVALKGLVKKWHT